MNMLSEIIDTILYGDISKAQWKILETAFQGYPPGAELDDEQKFRISMAATIKEKFHKESKE
jgi:hypothetical protein